MKMMMMNVISLVFVLGKKVSNGRVSVVRVMLRWKEVRGWIFLLGRMWLLFVYGEGNLWSVLVGRL